MSGAETVGLAVDNSRIYLDRYVKKLSKRANTFTIAVFDCCRVNEAMKAGPPKHNIKQYGQNYILYAAAEG